MYVENCKIYRRLYDWGYAFLVLVFVFNFDLFKFSAAILEKGLLLPCAKWGITIETLVSCYHITQENYKLNF